jgi:hypothetical protein
VIYAQATHTFEALVEGLPTGLTGTLGVRIVDPPAGTTVAARTTAGIVEQVAGSGVYGVVLTAPGVGEYAVVWDTGGGTPVFASEELLVSAGPPSVAPNPGPSYTTPDALRAELVVDSTVLPDARAVVIIENAEDLVDEELGVWPVDSVTGRKILQSYCEAWQWTKLGRATTKLAARLYNDPKIVDQAYRKLSGPDFAHEDPLGSVLGDDVAALLTQSGLRRLTTQINQGSGRGGRPPWYSFSYNDTSWDVDPGPIFRGGNPNAQ